MISACGARLDTLEFPRLDSSPANLPTLEISLPTSFTSPTASSIFEPPQTQTFNIDQSVLGISLEVIRVGRGETTLVLIGALHGTEFNASHLLNDLSQHYLLNPPNQNSSIYFLSIANPDGRQANSRFNANGVDLNRNWETLNWQTDTFGPTGSVQLGGGAKPFSEPETTAISSWLLDLSATSSSPLTVIFFHSAYPPSGLVLPSYTLTEQIQVANSDASAYAIEYAKEIHSEFSINWDEYPITGEALNWCGLNQIICLDIELPSFEDLTPDQTQAHITALDNLINTLVNK